MTIKAGDTMPTGVLTHMTKDGPQKITTNQLFGGKKVVLFSAPPVLPDVSYRSGRPRSCPNSCANTPRPPFSGCIV